MTGTGSANYAGDASNPINYGPAGGIKSLKLGSQLVETTTYNSRLQPVSLAAGSLLTIVNCYDASQQQTGGSCSTVTGTLPSGNNGNIWAQVMNGVARNYGYDSYNRLTSASQGGGQTFTYDTRGNRAVTGAGSANIEVPSSTSVYGADNRNGNWDYDASGNVTRIPKASLGSALRIASYDAENRMASVTNSAGTTTTYVYDGDGRRISKSVPLSGGGAAVTHFVYDAMGQLMAEYGAASADSGTLYLTADPLGSTRLTTKKGVLTNDPPIVDSTIDYFPFGEEISSGYPVAQVAGKMDVKFTSKERDAETGLDFFNVRYFSSAQGRFTSPDLPLYDQNPFNPQSWNLYSYGRNNPLVNSDPSGRSCVKTQTSNPDGSKSDSFGDDGDGKGCEAAGIKPDSKGGLNASGQQFNVNAQQGSLLAFLFSSPVPRYVENDKPLDSRGQTVARELSKRIDNYPTVCGGGGYVYLGKEFDIGAANAFAGTIMEYDSREGLSKGALFEAGGGEGVVGGAGYVATTSGGKPSASGLAYAGVGVHSPVAAASAGVVGFGSGSNVSGVGLYGESFLFGQGGGVGGYVNLTNVGKCR